MEKYPCSLFQLWHRAIDRCTMVTSIMTIIHLLVIVWCYIIKLKKENINSADALGMVSWTNSITDVCVHGLCCWWKVEVGGESTPQTQSPDCKNQPCADYNSSLYPSVPHEFESCQSNGSDAKAFMEQSLKNSGLKSVKACVSFVWTLYIVAINSSTV